jgi:uroporphyrinogen-III decarboxylase
LGNHCCIMGNVPASLLSVGSPAHVEEYCRNLFRTAGRAGGFILTSGGFLDDARPENVKAMVDSARKYGRY